MLRDRGFRVSRLNEPLTLASFSRDPLSDVCWAILKLDVFGFASLKCALVTPIIQLLALTVLLPFPTSWQRLLLAAKLHEAYNSPRVRCRTAKCRGISPRRDAFCCKAILEVLKKSLKKAEKLGRVRAEQPNGSLNELFIPV